MVNEHAPLADERRPAAGGADDHAGRRQAKPRTIRWVTVAGGLPPGVDVADRAAMHDWLRQQR